MITVFLEPLFDEDSVEDIFGKFYSVGNTNYSLFSSRGLLFSEFLNSVGEVETHMFLSMKKKYE